MKLVILDEQKKQYVYHEPDVFKKLLVDYAKKMDVDDAFDKVVDDLKQLTKYK